MDKTETIIKKSRAFFQHLLQTFSKDLNTLTAAPNSVVLEDIEIIKGNADVQEMFSYQDRNVVRADEDDQNGHAILVMDIASSIELTGLMMMMGEQVIANQSKSREYNEEIHEGFKEVAGQLISAFNDYSGKDNKKPFKLFNQDVEYNDCSELPKGFVENCPYLKVTARIQIAKSPPQDFFILLSELFVIHLFNTRMTRGKLPEVLKVEHLPTEKSIQKKGTEITFSTPAVGIPSLEVLAVCTQAIVTLETQNEIENVLQYLKNHFL